MVITDDLSDETASPERVKEIQKTIMDLKLHKDVVISNMLLRDYGKPLTDKRLPLPPEET